jgi:cytochrome c oxidase assembly protein subunit 15
MKSARALSVVAVALAFVVVVMGAYVRLSDAGLGCPDWPFCYGRPLPAEIADQYALARAWKEMGHRYLAGTLGVLIVALAVLAWRARRARWLATAIIALVVLQATLGKWTVTMLLKPAIVTAHLLGGMGTLALLTWLALAQWPHAPARETDALRPSAAIALGVLIVQIALGGWVSANYAALACPDLPLCRAGAIPPLDFANAFHVVRDLGRTAQGELLSLDALAAIHWTHRVVALVALTVALFAAVRARRSLPAIGALVGVLVAVQFALGVANVALGMPLALAAAHNAGAALLLVALVVLNFFAFRGLRPS